MSIPGWLPLNGVVTVPNAGHDDQSGAGEAAGRGACVSASARRKASTAAEPSSEKALS
jgi:hypothetical protein